MWNLEQHNVPVFNVPVLVLNPCDKTDVREIKNDREDSGAFKYWYVMLCKKNQIKCSKSDFYCEENFELNHKSEIIARCFSKKSVRNAVPLWVINVDDFLSE